MSIKKSPLVSICILNYNGSKRLPKAIPSILSQNYSNLEFLFLDNCSTDNSLDYISQFKEIKVIESEKNLGISGGRNKLAEISQGEYLFFIDNDVELIQDDFVLRILNDYLCLKDEKIGILFPIFRLCNDDKYCDAGLYSNKVVKEKFIMVYNKGFIKKPGFLGTAFIIQRKLFLDIGGFDEKYPYNMDDYDFSMRLYNMGYTIFLDSNLYAIHHGIETRITAKGIGWRYQYYFCGLMRSILKNYKTNNILKWCFIIFGWSFVKSLKSSIKYFSMLPLKGFFTSVKYFFTDLSDTLFLRKIYQKKRVINEDLFLKIK